MKIRFTGFRHPRLSHDSLFVERLSGCLDCLDRDILNVLFVLFGPFSVIGLCHDAAQEILVAQNVGQRWPS